MSRRLADGHERSSINLRVKHDVRRALEEAAAKSGRSLTQEVEARVIRSFSAADQTLLIREQMAAILEPAIEQAVVKALGATPEPIGSPPPVYRQ